MVSGSGLVDGGGALGRRAALILLNAGFEVTVLGESADDPTSGVGVELRPAVHLIGAVPVDRHIEAELSDGRVENYDLVVIVEQPSSPAQPPWRLLTSGSAEVSDAVRDAAAALAAQAEPASS